MPLPKKLLQRGITDMVRVSDARMSGTAYGTVVLHVTPESAAGGPLALVRDGDEIELDVEARKLELCVAEEELARRARGVDTAAAACEWRISEAIHRSCSAGGPRARIWIFWWVPAEREYPERVIKSGDASSCWLLASSPLKARQLKPEARSQKLEARFYMKEFDGKVAIVTGTTGIGRAIAKRFAAGGAKLLACGIEAAANQELALEAKASGLSLRVEQCDVTQVERGAGGGGKSGQRIWWPRHHRQCRRVSSLRHGG